MASPLHSCRARCATDLEGPIVRIAPNTLSFNTASALSTIYGPRSANVKKAEWYKTFDIAAGTYSSFTETDREMHGVRRRWMSPAFSAESLKANEASVIDIIERFCETIKPKDGGWGKKWNASEMSTYLGFDIMGALVFGADFRTVHEEGNRDLANSVLPASMLMYWVSKPRRYWRHILTVISGILPPSRLLSTSFAAHQLLRTDRRKVRSGQQPPHRLLAQSSATSSIGAERGEAGREWTNRLPVTHRESRRQEDWAATVPCRSFHRRPEHDKRRRRSLQ
jgi:cytochrome P450